MFVTLVEVRKTPGGSTAYTLHETRLAPSRVIQINDYPKMKQALLDGHLPDDLDKNHEFSMLSIDNGNAVHNIVVVGAPQLIEEKLSGGKKKILKG